MNAIGRQYNIRARVQNLSASSAQYCTFVLSVTDYFISCTLFARQCIFSETLFSSIRQIVYYVYNRAVSNIYLFLDVPFYWRHFLKHAKHLISYQGCCINVWC